MARLARHRLGAECVPTNALYHVTNRGVGRQPIFDSDLDRLVFLAILASVCLDDGLRVHAFCLMSNHFHLLAEDPRGMLSRMMLRLQTTYARYFIDARGRRGSGHLFGDRFFCERVDSAPYYDQLASYILLNPLRCTPALTASPETYPWSSAALHLSTEPPLVFFQKWLERLGGLDAILAAMPKVSRPEYQSARRARFDALAAGDWIDADAARCSRTPEQMRQVLNERVGISRPEPSADSTTDRSAAHSAGRQRLVPPIGSSFPRSTPPYMGTELLTTMPTIVDELLRFVPDRASGLPQLTCYALWRFTSATARKIGRSVGATSDTARQAIERMRSLRRTEPAWDRLLSRLEWRLLFRVRSAPWRI